MCSVISYLCLTLNNFQDSWPVWLQSNTPRNIYPFLLAVIENCFALHQPNCHQPSSLDLSAALKTVNQKTLLSILKSVGISSTVWWCFTYYLEGYQVTWNESTLAPCWLSIGVPQGSMLGPLLFSIFTHSLSEVSMRSGCWHSTHPVFLSLRHFFLHRSQKVW